MPMNIAIRCRLRSHKLLKPGVKRDPFRLGRYCDANDLHIEIDPASLKTASPEFESKSRKLCRMISFFIHVPKCGGTTLLSSAVEHFGSECVHHIGYPRHGETADDIGVMLFAIKRSGILKECEAVNAYHYPSSFTDYRSWVDGTQPSNPGAIKCVFGHGVRHGMHHSFGHGGWRYFSALRHPVSRIVSVYNFLVTLIERVRTVESENQLSVCLEPRNLFPFDEWIYRDPNQVNFIFKFFWTVHFENEPVFFLNIPVDNETVNQNNLKSILGIMDEFDFIASLEEPDDLQKLAAMIGLPSPMRRRNVSKKVVQLDRSSSFWSELEQRNAADMTLYEHARTGKYRRSRAAQSESHSSKGMIN